MFVIRLLTNLQVALLITLSNCLCQEVPLDAPPGVRLRAATSIINPGSAELGDAINTTRQLMWAVGVHKDSVFAEVQTIVGYNENFSTEKAALERRAAAAATASLTNTNELRDARAELTRVRTQLGVLTRERDGLTAARLAVQRQLDAALLERNTHRDETVRITAQLADLRRRYEEIERNLIRVTAEKEAARASEQREKDRYLELDALYRNQLAELAKLQAKLVKRKTKHAGQIAVLQDEVDNYKEQLMQIKAQMDQIQRAIDPSLGTKDLVLEINNLRAHPYISANPEESIKDALDRKLAEIEQAKRIKRAMMGAGFLAIEKPFDTLVLIGQIISADGTYGRTGGENQIPTTTIDETVKAINILTGKTDANAQVLLSSIAEGMGVDVDQLPRAVMALRPWATLTENLRGAGKRDVFSELRGIAVKRTGVRSPLSGVISPPPSPVIKSPTHPDAMDTVFAFAESIRRQVEEQHSKGRILGPDGLAGWLKNDLGLRRTA